MPRPSARTGTTGSLQDHLQHDVQGPVQVAVLIGHLTRISFQPAKAPLAICTHAHRNILLVNFGCDIQGNVQFYSVRSLVVCKNHL